MIKDIIIKIPLVDQNKDVKNKKWKKKSCAICSTKMMLGFSNKKHLEIDVGQLIDEASKLGSYMEGIGWKHKTISDLAKKYGIKLNFINKFPKTLKEKSRWLRKFEDGIMNGKPIMASIYYKLSKKNGGHIVVVNGIRKKGKIVLGYHIQDPDNRFKGNNYYISKDKFLLGWRGGMIYFQK
ncbi:MAG: C39 family peptidase [Candidatus Taylorbacteria bacterium]|nr:C39 family peptidase [Candidatus Taylorbacteria bacterium]